MNNVTVFVDGSSFYASRLVTTTAGGVMLSYPSHLTFVFFVLKLYSTLTL